MHVLVLRFFCFLCFLSLVCHALLWTKGRRGRRGGDDREGLGANDYLRPSCGHCWVPIHPFTHPPIHPLLS
ncbi:MAG: hypothetical protein BYD32DRAFT_416585 [Podila humilis]|nr:MAG: hypothetical protein BYD32DRAFT_416585 [Podila humilis]